MFTQINVLYPKPAFTTAGAVADQSTTVLTAAIAPTGYTDAVVGSAQAVLVTFDVQVANVRCRWDGVNPTSSTGHLLFVGQSFTWPVSQYNATKFICDGAGTTATIWASAMKN